MPGWQHALLCVAVPCGIGGVMYLLVGLWDRALRRRRPDRPLPPVDYSI